MMMRELLSEFPWGEEVEFHSIDNAPETLCATFLSDAEEICVNGDLIKVDIKTPKGMAPPPEWLYDISRLKFFVEHVLNVRRKQYPDNEYPTDEDVARFFFQHTNHLMTLEGIPKEEEK